MLEHKKPLAKYNISITKVLQEGLIDDGGFDWGRGVFTTPVSNTGVLSTCDDFDLSLHLGWFTISFKAPTYARFKDFFETIKNIFCLMFKDEIVGKTMPSYGYGYGVSTTKGAFFYWSDDRLDFTFKLSETYCRKFTIAGLLLNIADLVEAGGSITRMDLTIDDLSKQLNIKYIHDAKFTTELCARVSTVGYTTKHRGIKHSYEMTTLGSRESLLSSRIYDKTKESKGKIDSIRWEMELKKAYAMASFFYLFTRSFPDQDDPAKKFEFSEVGFRSAILGILISKYEFKDPSTSNQKFRRSLSEWWVSFTGAIDKAEIKLPKIEPSIEKTINWVREQVGTSLNILSKHYEMDFFEFICNVIAYSEPKLRARHLAILRS